jgi:hypothetical protein
VAKVVLVAGVQGRRNDPFAGAAPLLDGLEGDADPGGAAFDRVDEMCADGPVVLCADDAHNLDGATLTLLRRLVWASRDLPLAVLINTRPFPSRAPLAQLIGQAQVRLWPSPMSPMTVERVTRERMGRWPGPLCGVSSGWPRATRSSSPIRRVVCVRAADFPVAFRHVRS